MVVRGSPRAWAAAGGGREGVCGTAKTSFSDLEGWVTGRVCMPLAGPLPSGVTHSCERVGARSAACRAWRRRRACSGGMSSRVVRTGVCWGRRGTAWGCLWEKSSLMWAVCLLQADFVALLPLCFYFFFSPFCFYLQEGALRALQLHSGAHRCRKRGNVLSLDLCSVSVSSSWLGWKTTSLGSERSRPGQGGWMGLGSQAAAAVLCCEGSL